MKPIAPSIFILDTNTHRCHSGNLGKSVTLFGQHTRLATQQINAFLQQQQLNHFGGNWSQSDVQLGSVVLSLYTIQGIYFINSWWKKNKGCSIKYSRNWNCLVWLVFDDSMQMTLLYSREQLNGNLSLANGNVAKPHWLNINYSMVTPTGEGESLQQMQVSPEFWDLMWFWRQNHDYQKHLCLVPQLFWKQKWGGSCHVFGVFVQV